MILNYHPEGERYINEDVCENKNSERKSKVEKGKKEGKRVFCGFIPGVLCSGRKAVLNLS